jgi:hypothetical protein
MRLRLTCKEASRLQSQGLDRTLTLPERISLRLHTTVCDACTRVGRQLAFLRRALREYPGPDHDDRG